MCGQGGPANRKESALLVTGLQRRCCGCFAHVGTGGGGDGGDGAGGGGSKCRGLWMKEGKGGGWGDGGGGERERRWTEVDAGQGRSKKIKWRKERAMLLDCESVSSVIIAYASQCKSVSLQR